MIQTPGRRDSICCAVTSSMGWTGRLDAWRKRTKMEDMCRNLLLLFTIFVTPLALFTMPFDTQADPADLGEIAHMRFGHQKVEGIVTDSRSGLCSVKTSTGTNYTLAESVVVRYGREVPKVGDEMILLINEGNHIMDARKKGVILKSVEFC